MNGLHPSRIDGILIIQPVQMQQAVDNVKTQLASEGISEALRIPSGHFRADENFAVLKGDYVGWASFVHEFLMERRDLVVRNDQYGNLAQLREIGFFCARQLQAKLHRFRRELFEIDSVNADFALPIADDDSRQLHFARRIRSSCLSNS